MRQRVCIRRLAAVIPALTLLSLMAAPAHADFLSSISLLQSTPVPSATSDHTFTFSNQNTGATIRCVTVSYSVNADGSGGAPAGFDATAATFGGTFLASWAGWTTSNTTGVAKTTLAGGATPAAGAGRTIVLDDVVNGSTPDTAYYVTVATFTNAGCTTLQDTGALALVWTRGSTVSVTVESSLGFTVAGNNAGSCNGAVITATNSTATTVPLGRVNSSTDSVASQLLSVNSNGGGGYTVYARSTGTLGPIPDWPGTNANPTAWVGPGISGFGYSTDHALTASGVGSTRFQTNKWAGLAGSNDEVAYEASGPIAGGSSEGRSKVCYKVGVDESVDPGDYTTTVLYTAVPGF